MYSTIYTDHQACVYCARKIPLHKIVFALEEFAQVREKGE